MKNTLLFLGIAFASAGCAPDGKLLKLDVPNECFDGAGRGVTFTPVFYGDSYLAAFEISQVTYGSQWFFRLRPERKPTDPDDVNYNTVNVTIRAAVSANQDWLDETRTFASSDGQFWICVPRDESDVVVDDDGLFKYDVIVEEVGQLDPRGRVMD